MQQDLQLRNMPLCVQDLAVTAAGLASNCKNALAWP